MAIFKTFLHGVFDENIRRYTIVYHLELLGEVLAEKHRIEPVKKFSSISLFLKDDLVEKKKQLVNLREKYRQYK